MHSLGRGETEVGAAGKSSVARGGPPRGAAERTAGNGGRATVFGLALRFTLNAPPCGLRRAALQARPKTRNYENSKGDTSNEVSKGTFLIWFDTILLDLLT